MGRVLLLRVEARRAELQKCKEDAAKGDSWRVAASSSNGPTGKRVMAGKLYELVGEVREALRKDEVELRVVLSNVAHGGRAGTDRVAARRGELERIEGARRNMDERLARMPPSPSTSTSSTTTITMTRAASMAAVAGERAAA